MPACHFLDGNPTVFAGYERPLREALVIVFVFTISPELC
jgi:hypothetical protein